jgi:hypothetical protein
MAVEKVLYAVRIPVDLKRLIDSAAASGGVNTSQLVVDALWKYLDRKPSIDAPEPIPAIPPVKMNPAMERFMAKLPAPIVAPEPLEDAAPSCSECDRRMFGKYLKGRGMVYACTDNSCPMYGMEAKV